MKQKAVIYLSFGFFVCALLWGIYTLFYYIGVPVHGSVILPGETAGRLNEFCDGADLACRGLFGFVPFVVHTLRRMNPLLWYGVFSAALYGALLFINGVRTGHLVVSFRMRPWHVYAAFLVSLTLIFTVISFGKIDVNTTSGVRATPMRQIVEPNPQVYSSAKPEALAVLQRNFQQLQDGGCLKYNGQFSAAAGQYLVKGHCIYSAYVSRVLTQVLFVTLLLFELLVTGRMLLMLARFRSNSILSEAMLSASLGACMWVAILWFMAVFKVLTAPIGWTALAVVLALGWKHAKYWLEVFVKESVPIHLSWRSVRVLLFWLLISYLAFNFLNVVRPFPIGWDDLGSYLNRPRLMVSYGEFIYSMAPFQWEYLTSLGYLLFGYSSPFGATASMQVNWMAGLLAIGAIFLFTNTFLGQGRGMLAALLYYALPLVGHFSFADMKMDNAVFTMGAMSMFCMFMYLFPKLEEEEVWRPNWQWLILSGLLGGFAFGMKQTAVMVIMANAAILIGVLLHWSAFFGAVIASLFVFAFKGILDISKITDRIAGTAELFTKGQFMFIVFAMASIVFVAAVVVARKKFPLAGKSAAILVVATIIPILPWVMHNNSMRGWVHPGLELGAPNTLTPTFDLDGKRIPEPGDENLNLVTLPPELALDLEHEHCQPTGNVEELDRYWGFSEGWKHYVTLPWRTVHNLDSAGYYVTTQPGLLMFPLLLLLPFFWLRKSGWIRWLFMGTLFILLEWMFLANGIPWYGIGVFLGLCIGLEVMIAKAPDFPSRMVLAGLATVWVLLMFNNRFWQYEMQRNIFEYPMGKVDAETLQERTIPHYDDIADVVVQRNRLIPDRPYLYRVGTFIPYFIPKNLEVIGLVDHQLDMFNCIHQEREPELTTQRLKALGFNSFVFDTNTATIERDPNGSLHQKVKLFTDFLSNPDSGMQIVVNDPGAGIAFILIP